MQLLSDELWRERQSPQQALGAAGGQELTAGTTLPRHTLNSQNGGMLHFEFLDLIKVYSVSSQQYIDKEQFFSNNPAIFFITSLAGKGNLYK